MIHRIKEIGRFIKASKQEKKIIVKHHINVRKLFRLVQKDVLNKIYTSNELSNIYVVTIMKNEAPYLKEWLEYYLMIGVDKFIIYDNGSTDETISILKRYIELGIVEYNSVYVPKPKLHHPQKEVYTDAVLRHRDHCRWMAFVDVDEYIVPEKDFLLIDAINKIYTLYKNDGGIAINWLNYGSSFFDKKPEGLTIDNYIYRSCDDYEANELVKTIANPKLVVEGGIHQPRYYEGFYNINENGIVVGGNDRIKNSHSTIRINHYASKSKEEALDRQRRKFGGSKLVRKTHDVNDLEDNIMSRYSMNLKEAMKNER